MGQETEARCIGLVGFGEVGKAYAAALLRANVAVKVYHPGPRPQTEAAAREMGVRLFSSAEPALSDCDLILNVSPGSHALNVAQAVAPCLKAGALFADLSTASPDHLRSAASEFPHGGYVDVAILGAVSIHGHATPMLASGTGASRLKTILAPFGFVIDILEGGQPGDATALKLIRSILTKGLDALTIETLLVAETLGLRQALLSNIGDLDRSTLSELMAMFVRTHAPHALRRLHEMQAVEQMLADIDVPLIMTRATTHRYAHSVDVVDAARHAKPDAPAGRNEEQMVSWLLSAERLYQKKTNNG